MPEDAACVIIFLSRETLNVLSEGDDDTSKASDTDKFD